MTYPFRFPHLTAPQHTSFPRCKWHKRREPRVRRLFRLHRKHYQTNNSTNQSTRTGSGVAQHERTRTQRSRDRGCAVVLTRSGPRSRISAAGWATIAHALPAVQEPSAPWRLDVPELRVQQLSAPDCVLPMLVPRYVQHFDTQKRSR